MEVVEGDERRRKGGRETNADAKQGHLHTGGGGEKLRILNRDNSKCPI